MPSFLIGWWPLSTERCLPWVRLLEICCIAFEFMHQGNRLISVTRQETWMMLQEGIWLLWVNSWRECASLVDCTVKLKSRFRLFKCVMHWLTPFLKGPCLGCKRIWKVNCWPILYGCLCRQEATREALNWHLGYLRLWKLQGEQLWAALHQPGQWEAAATIQPACLQGRAGKLFSHCSGFLSTSSPNVLLVNFGKKPGASLLRGFGFCFACIEFQGEQFPFSSSLQTYLLQENLNAGSSLSRYRVLVILVFQEEYAQEGIDWSYVEFVDNQDCLDLLETGVFPLIDEACRLMRATYQVTPTHQGQSYLPSVTFGARYAACMFNTSSRSWLQQAVLKAIFPYFCPCWRKLDTSHT